MLRSTASGSAGDAALAGARWVDEGRRRPRALFGDLLRAVGAIDGIDRVRFTSPHPKDLRDDVIAAMAETPAVCEQLHLPLQSGSDRVLRAMRRGYTADRYLERLAAARAAIDDLAVTTDLIVGFPGESEDDFDATLAVAAEAEFDSAFTFIFSPRSGTLAAEMASAFVPEGVIADRFARLKPAVVDRSALRRTSVGSVGSRRLSSKDAPARTRRSSRAGPARASSSTSTPTGSHFVPGDRATVEITGRRRAPPLRSPGRARRSRATESVDPAGGLVSSAMAAPEGSWRVSAPTLVACECVLQGPTSGRRSQGQESCRGRAADQRAGRGVRATLR